tara:strand:+ start:283 stop:489 length:207 start_codon:yes stop_codon:yes gene_type:complete
MATTTTLRRVFKHGSIELPDPSLALTPIQVRDSYAATYPELATATIKGPDHANGKETYTFKQSIGTKG